MTDLKWYVVHTQTGLEGKARSGLMVRAQMQGLAEKIQEVLIPTEKVSEVKGGKKRITERKFYPGYILVRMDLNGSSPGTGHDQLDVSGTVDLGMALLDLIHPEADRIVSLDERHVRSGGRHLLNIYWV